MNATQARGNKRTQGKRPAAVCVANILEEEQCKATLMELLRCKGARMKEVEEQLEVMPDEQLQEVSKTLGKLVTESVQALSDANENFITNSRSEHGTSKGDAEAQLQAIAVFARVALKRRSATKQASVAALIIALHDQALLALLEYPSVQDAVVKACLDLYGTRSAEGAKVSLQLVPYLLWKGVNGRAADVKRCLAVRDALQQFDLAHPDSSDLYELLLRAMQSPSFLKVVDGRRLLASFFDLDRKLVADLCSLIKNQIAVSKAHTADQYGDVLFRAWQNSNEEHRTLLESKCIQGLMHSAVLASTTQLHSNLRRVVRVFCDHKQVQGVDAMLNRLYEPFLWSYLKVANARVRVQALHCLLDAFPLHDPDALDNEGIEEMLTMQLNQLIGALRDPVPDVREEAARGACELLNAWWELLPAQPLSKLMVTLQATAFDASSPRVRVTLLLALADLVDNPMAHSALHIMLPHLRTLLYDPHARARAAMASLLERVSHLKTFKWWEIVPVQELIGMLGTDTGAARDIIQRILMAQFVKLDGVSGTLEACAGLLQLLRDNTAAGHAFCAAVAGRSRHGVRMDAEALEELSGALLDYLLHCEVSAPGRNKRTAVGGTKRTDRTIDERTDNADDNDNSDKDDDDDDENDLYNEADGSAKGRNRDSGKSRPNRKRNASGAALDADAGAAAVETPTDWAALMTGLVELMLGCHSMLVELTREDAKGSGDVLATSGKRSGATSRERAAATASPVDKRGRRRAAETAAGEDEEDASADEGEQGAVEVDVWRQLLPASALRDLFERAATVEGTRAVLQLATAAARDGAVCDLGLHCVSMLQKGCVALPGACRGAQRGVRIFLKAFPRSGSITGQQASNLDVIGDVVAFLNQAVPDDLLALIADGLKRCEGGQRRQAAESRGKATTQGASNEASLEVGGALVLLSLLHSDADANLGRSVTNAALRNCLDAVAEVAATLLASTFEAPNPPDAPAPASSSTAPDLLIAARSLQRLSAGAECRQWLTNAAPTSADSLGGICEHASTLTAALLQPFAALVAADADTQAVTDLPQLLQALQVHCSEPADATEGRARAPKRARNILVADAASEAGSGKTVVVHVAALALLDVCAAAHVALDAFEDAQSTPRTPSTAAAADEHAIAETALQALAASVVAESVAPALAALLRLWVAALQRVESTSGALEVVRMGDLCMEALTKAIEVLTRSTLCGLDELSREAGEALFRDLGACCLLHQASSHHAGASAAHRVLAARFAAAVLQYAAILDVEQSPDTEHDLNPPMNDGPPQLDRDADVSPHDSERALEDPEQRARTGRASVALSEGGTEQVHAMAAIASLSIAVAGTAAAEEGCADVLPHALSWAPTAIQMLPEQTREQVKAALVEDLEVELNEPQATEDDDADASSGHQTMQRRMGSRALLAVLSGYDVQDPDTPGGEEAGDEVLWASTP